MEIFAYYVVWAFASFGFVTFCYMAGEVVMEAVAAIKSRLRK